MRSEEFSRSPRLSRFLKYIVETTLKGRGKRLKGYTIGIEVFGKPETFDPEQDASVRVDAGRLRRSLANYYAGEGRHDPVRIHVPSGTYVPVFERQPSSFTGAANRLVDHVRGLSAGGLAIALLCLLGFGAALGLSALLLVEPDVRREITGSVTAQFDEVLERPTGPTVAVLPFKAIGNSHTELLAYGFTHHLLTDLTRFRSLRVLGMDTVRSFGDLDSRADGAEGLKADYVVEGTLQSGGGKTRTEARLLDVRHGNYIWAHVSDESVTPDNIMQVQARIVGEIAGRLGQPHGVVQRVEAERMKTEFKGSFEPYKCVLSHYGYSRNKTPEGHAQVRDCLERTVKENPNYTEAWALLSWIYGDEIRYGYNLRKDAADARQRAGYAASQAVRSGPESARAHQYAATAALLRDDVEAVRRHLALALELNPNDADILADAGWIYSQLGEWEFGKSIIEKAIWLNPGHPPWYFGALFAYHYQRRSYREALEFALRFYQPEALLPSFALAATYGKLEMRTEASEAVKHLVQTFPDFAAKPRVALQGWRFPKDFMDELLDGARKAGLNLTAAG